MDYLLSIKTIEQKIDSACKQANRSPKEISVIAVSKQFPLETVNSYLNITTNYWHTQAITRMDIRPHLGENKVQEVLSKKPDLYPHTLHFIGHLQTNKVKQILPHIDYLHSLESVKLADCLNHNLLELNRNTNTNKKLKVFIQANPSAEASKYGGDFEETRTLLKHALTLPQLEICGLMTMAPFSENKNEIRTCFRNLREWRNKLQNEVNISLAHLSMGMSHDYELAIAEGATMVRIGSAIFGTRTYP